MAKDQAQVNQDPEWVNKTKRMLQTVREKETNKKLTAILQDPHQPVRGISVPVKKVVSLTGKERDVQVQ